MHGLVPANNGRQTSENDLTGNEHANKGQEDALQTAPDYVNAQGRKIQGSSTTL